MNKDALRDLAKMYYDDLRRANQDYQTRLIDIQRGYAQSLERAYRDNPTNPAELLDEYVRVITASPFFVPMRTTK